MSPRTKPDADVPAEPVSSELQGFEKHGHTSVARKRSIAGVLLLLLIGASGFVMGVWYSRQSAPLRESTRRILYYHDPMHPEYRSDKPGIAPDCGMQLEPVYADAQPSRQPASRLSTSQNEIRADVDKLQAIGIVAEEVRKAPFVHRIRTVGRVVPDETRISRVVAGTEGWVRQIFPQATGTLAQKGDLLAIYYARDFQAAQQSYLYALKNRETAEAGGAAAATMVATAQAQIDSAVDNLLALGLSEAQLQELARKRETNRNIELRAPTTGFILGNDVYAGMRFERGSELVRVADLSSVWVTADLYGNDAAQLKPGSRAEILVPHGKTSIRATVSDTLPQFDPKSRTTKVRLQAPNPSLVMRAGMFVDIVFPVDLPPSVHVPVDSVIASGTTNDVFVERRPGVYERRTAQKGWEFGDRVQILSGVEAGERVVRSGAFLLDSDTRMKRRDSQPAVSSALRDVVCGMNLAERTHTSTFKSHTFAFCSKSCKAKFDLKPETYARAADQP